MKHNFKYYCKDYENIENYEKALTDNFKGWCVHHRLETHNSDGERRAVDISAPELQALGMYYGRPASELIFMKKSEHKQLHMKGEHHPMYGKQLYEETKIKISKANKGKQAWNKGKTLSEETKRKMSEVNKGRMKCMHFFNNGKINIRAKECPDGFVPGRIKKL